MAAEKAPAFQFYPKEFLTDGNVAGMSLMERGAYITLLCLCWQEQSLPLDTQRLANMVGTPHKAFMRLWAAIAACFLERDGRLIHPRLDKERQKQADFREMQSEKGKLGGRPRKADVKPDESRRLAEPKAEAKPEERSPISDLRSPIKELKISTRQTASHLSADAEERFSRFWECYPNKKGKDAARKAWQKRQPSEALTEIIIAAVCEQVSWPDWKKDQGQFVPHPATWLNRGSWDDEPTIRTVPAWTCPSDPPCPPGTSGFRCHQRAQLEAAKRERTA